ncbi:MAG: flagellar hook-basal body complex protein FliE [Myxococcales bacterium]|nr:flagellar hook-basal body complex protein FliE [Myxococcales bacterium]
MVTNTVIPMNFELPHHATQPKVGLGLQKGLEASSSSQTNSSANTNFYEVFTEAMDAVRGNYAEAKEATSSALIGQGTPHNAMLAMAKADLTFRFMTQTRNKVVDAYREFMNMRM